MINQSRGIFRIGTSGIVTPGTKESFPNEFKLSSRLNYYASLFNTLEVNSTFYKIPRQSTFKKWLCDVPTDFQFTIKVWQEVTHVKQLNINLENIDVFFTSANHIGDKKGCLLIQLPGRITADFTTPLKQILVRLDKLDPENQWRKAIEFRSLTWYSSKTYTLLDKYNTSIVLHDMPKSKNFNFNEGAAFIYFRFHGPKGDYRGSYSIGFLEEQAEKMRSLLHEGKDVYAYFNNTMGNAFENAMSLKAMVDK
jgi:uncharacterized protein YecE (DUF72 family)